MAEYERYVKTETVVRYVLALPTNIVELDKAFIAACREYAQQHGILGTTLPDDAITVSGEDGLLVLSWVKP